MDLRDLDALLARPDAGTLHRTSSLLLRHAWAVARGSAPPRLPPLSVEEARHAAVIVRALLYAAHAAGAFDRREEDRLLRHLGDLMPEARHTLRDLVASPPTVAEYAFSVPLGLEREVYAVSLLVFGERAPRRAAYLRELARGLRLTPQVCARIHAEHGLAPLSF